MLHLKHKHSANKYNKSSKLLVMEEGKEIPKYKIPQESMLARSAYQIVHDECMLDGMQDSIWQLLLQPVWSLRHRNL